MLISLALATALSLQAPPAPADEAAQTGQVKKYTNNVGKAALPVTDQQAFPCP